MVGDKRKKGKISSAVINVILILIAIACIMPVVLVISISLSSMDAIYEKGYTFFPSGFNLNAYKYIFKDFGSILNSYWVSIRVVLIGGFFSVLTTALIAYPLSRRNFRYRKSITFIIFFTMLFNGGLVPTYMVVTNMLHLKNSMLALILPYLVTGWNVMMVRTFFKDLPEEIFEAAAVDGYGEYSIFFSIVLPMSKPAIATIALLQVLRYWNDWWLPLLYIENDKMVPLQYMLYRLMNNISEMQKEMAAGNGMTVEEFPTEPARMAMAVIAAGPMLCVFPFFQKYFAKGMTVGSVKG